MEATTAIGHAASITQFIDVIRRLISSARQLSEQGATTEYLELESIAKHLRSLAESLRPEKTRNRRLHLVTPNRELARLRGDCIAITDQLLSVLDSIKLEEGSTRWESLYQTLRTVWNADQIEGLQKRVDRIGQALLQHVTASELASVSRKLDQLAAENLRLEAERVEDIKKLRAQLSWAVDDNRGGSYRDESSRSRWSALHNITTAEAQYSAEQHILSRLRFDMIKDRYEGIPLGSQGNI